jgi:hypothetical protein
LSAVAVATQTGTSALDAEAAAGRSPMRLFEPSGSTLEDLILGAWEDLAAGGPAECPVCHGRLRPAGGCESCGSRLD